MNPWIGAAVALIIGAPTGLVAWWVLRDIERDVERAERLLDEDLSAAGEAPPRAR